ncbi:MULTISPECIES: hypothetical protein [unclassified Bacillus (in: firmicutes)]|nr:MULTISPECIES: hypothetical protein [unclassified Bacillus (in: firmicutes)]
MNGVLSASKLMKAAQVRKECAEAINNPAVDIRTASCLFSKAIS